MDIEIRPIEPEDTKEFVKFYEKLAKESDYLPFTPDEVEDNMEKEEEYIKKYNDYKQVFIAIDEDDDDEKIVGYLGISRSHLSRLTHTAKLTVGVLDEHKRNGIATQLLEYAEGWAEENDVTRLEINVLDGNEPAIKLFQKNGYVQEGVRKGSFMIDDETGDEIFMAKML